MKSIPLKGTKNAKTIPLKSEHRYATINTCGVPFPDLFKTQFPIVIAYLANNIGLCVKQKFHSFQTLNAKIKFPTFYQRLPDFVQPSPPLPHHRVPDFFQPSPKYLAPSLALMMKAP